MPNLSYVATMHREANVITGAGRGPRRSTSRRTDNVFSRLFRPLVTGSSPDHPATRAMRSGSPVQVMPPPPALPFIIHTLPRTRLGTVPKLAPGSQGSGLGVPVGGGFQTLPYVGFTPLESSPSNNPSFASIKIPKENVVAWVPGQALAASYRAHDFAPAQRFFRQSRSAPMWGQAANQPQQRPLITPVQINLLRNPSNIVRRQIPAAQVNAGLYTIGYPTQVGVAAQIGGGPISVLGGGY